MMQGREIGCKTLGCGTAIFFILFAFWGVLMATEKVAVKARAKRAAITAQSASQNLQALGISIASYEATMGHLPPTTSLDALKNALSPRFLSDLSILSAGPYKKTFLINPAISEKKRSEIKAPPYAVYILATEPDSKGVRTALFLSGEVHIMDANALSGAMMRQSPQPAPVERAKPVSSPAQSPR